MSQAKIEDLSEIASFTSFSNILKDYSYLKDTTPIKERPIIDNASIRKYLLGSGMNSIKTYKDDFLREHNGVFTPQEDKFVRSVMFQYNKKLSELLKANKIKRNIYQLNLTHARDTNGLITKSDIHLYCWDSKLGTNRVSKYKHATATHYQDIFNLLDFFYENSIKFDLIICDPRFKEEIANDRALFVRILIHKCTRILQSGGIIISKNWRSVFPINSLFVCGIITKYGANRRITTTEVIQFLPSVENQLTFSETSHKKEWEIDNIKTIESIFGNSNSWNDDEKDFIYHYLDMEKIKGICYISDKDTNDLRDLNVKLQTPSQFSKANAKYDLIILGKCRQIGGNTALTSMVFEKINSKLNPSGIAITKTYRDPVIEKKYKDIKKLEEKAIIYRNYSENDLINIYQKEKNLIPTIPKPKNEVYNKYINTLKGNKIKLHLNTIWDIPSCHRDYGKYYSGRIPAQIYFNFYYYFTKPYDTILDVFCGSGTGIDAGKDYNRKVIGLDINPCRNDITKFDVLQDKNRFSKNSIDHIFIDSPYYNMNKGKYTNLKTDLSNLNYREYQEALRTIIKKFNSSLKPNGYIGNILSNRRNREMTYYDLETDINSIFTEYYALKHKIIVPYHNLYSQKREVIEKFAQWKLINLSHRTLFIYQKNSHR